LTGGEEEEEEENNKFQLQRMAQHYGGHGRGGQHHPNALTTTQGWVSQEEYE
jgi:hypothetical protein